MFALLAFAVSIALADDPIPPVDAPPSPAPSPDPAPAPKPVKPWSIAGLPIANVSSDTGIGYGLYGSAVHNADPGSDDPFKARIAAQLFFTTKKYQDHNIKLDFPSIGGSPYRFDILAGYERWQQSPWYGVGNLAPRLKPYDEASPGAPGTMPTKDYYEYDVSWGRVLANVRRPVVGNLEVFGSYLFRFAVVKPYAGSYLVEQNPVGIDGGLYARLALGVMYDSRDAEPSPTKGVFDEASVRVSAAPVGSHWGVFGINLQDRRWFSIAGGDRLVLANRFIFDLRRGNEPFFAQQLLGGSSFVNVGGSNTLRALQEGRYRGDIVALWTPELRVKYGKLGPVEIFGVPFVDVGRVFLWNDDPALVSGDAVRDTNLLHLHYTGGIGHRFQVGQAMLVRLDIGFGVEEFGSLSDPTNIEKKMTSGFYLVFDHPF